MPILAKGLCVNPSEPLSGGEGDPHTFSCPFIFPASAALHFPSAEQIAELLGRFPRGIFITIYAPYKWPLRHCDNTQCVIEISSALPPTGRVAPTDKS